MPVDRDRHLRVLACSSSRFKQNAFIASIALAIIMLPLISRATQEVLALVPQSLREASQALGVSKWRTVLARRPPDDARRDRHRRDARGRARGRRDGADPLHVVALRQLGVGRPAAAARLDSRSSIFTYSESPDPNLHEQAWAAAFVLIVFVLVTSLTARFFLHRGRRKLAGRLGRSPFTNLSPPLHRLSAHIARRALDTGRRYDPTSKEGERDHMKRMLTTVAAVTRRRPRRCGRRRRRRARTRRLTGAGSTFVSPLVSLWAADYAVEDRHPDRLQPGRLRRAASRRSPPAQVDFGASDAPLSPDQFNGVQRLRPDPVGAVGDVDHLQPQRASRTTCT